MRKSARIALVGVIGGVALTVAPVVNPFTETPSTENTRSVVRPTPSVSPFPEKGTVPVVTPKPKVSVSPSKRPAESKRTQTRESASPTPSASRSAPKRQVTRERQTTERVTYISGYTFCGSSAGEAQPCIDNGSLVLYYPAGVTTLGGHNYKGWYWMDDLPVGRKVVIQSGKLAGTYRVYGNGYSTNKMFPANGKGADVALQTCEGEGIGFSFLRRA